MRKYFETFSKEHLHIKINKMKLLGKCAKIWINNSQERKPKWILHIWKDTQFSQHSHSVVSDFLRPHESQHARPPCPLPTPGIHSDSRPSSPWCHPAISSSVVPFSSCHQSLPASDSFPMSQLFAWGGQSTGVSASASFLPKKSQGWSPSEWTGWISLQSKGLSRVFSNTTVQEHQFFSAPHKVKCLSIYNTVIMVPKGFSEKRKSFWRMFWQYVSRALQFTILVKQFHF